MDIGGWVPANFNRTTWPPVPRVVAQVFMIDFKNDLLYVAGAVPGDKRKCVDSH